jgi:ADP-L-glycero-D-manno-heptose 6-epimerase
MNILVTGHKGFIGRNMIKYLKPRYSVVGYEYNKDYFPDLKNIDLIIHLGALTSTTNLDIKSIIEQNVNFSIKLIEQSVKKRINIQIASSASVYGNLSNFKEESVLKPESPYAASKFLVEKFFDSLDKKKINSCAKIFRYFNVYGENEENKLEQASPLTKFVIQSKKQKKIFLFKNSKNYLRDFIWVGDVCRLHEVFFKINQSGIFNVGTGKTNSFESIAKIIAKKYNAKIIYVSMPKNIKKHYQKYTRANLDNLKKYIKIRFKSPKKYLNEFIK